MGVAGGGLVNLTILLADNHWPFAVTKKSHFCTRIQNLMTKFSLRRKY